MVQPDSRTIARVDKAIRVSVFMVEFLGLSMVSQHYTEYCVILLYYQMTSVKVGKRKNRGNK